MKDKCDFNCVSCSYYQQIYCSTQMNIKIQDMISEILSILKSDGKNIIPINNDITKSGNVANSDKNVMKPDNDGQ